MRIKTIHMTQYKRFFDLTIDLGNTPKRIIALVVAKVASLMQYFIMLMHLGKLVTQIIIIMVSITHCCQTSHIMTLII
jgi:hypothetical protein